jgi:two-component system sensor histidine kinase KdpD
MPVSPTRLAHALLSVGIVFTLTVVMLLISSKTLGEGVIAILYLLPIGWCTVRWGQISGVSAALTAALSFDFLFIPPYGTFNIGSLEGWLLLFLFIATAILVVGRIQTILTEERERERKATFLYEMVAAIANQATREGIARAIANQIQQKFLAKDVQIHLSGEWGNQVFTARARNGQAVALAEKPDRAMVIMSGQALLGEIDIWQGIIALPAEEDPMLQTLLNQTVAALERVRVAEGKPPYPKQKPSYSEGNSLQTSHS